MTTDTAKRAAAKKAAELIEDNQIVGLGSGSTSAFFIEELGKRHLQLKAVVASSKQSAELAKLAHLPLCDIRDVFHIDVTVDGADEVDPLKRMIKGGGGAHVREKILAAASKEMIVIVDESKLVSQLGAAKLPVEILPYGAFATREKIELLGFKGSWREKGGKPFLTDNGNLLFDIHFTHLLSHPEKIDEEIQSIPGVVDTGFFFEMAGRVIVGYPDGKIKLFNT